METPHYNDNVFINCPFDENYNPLLNAMVFTIYDCGFIVRCALEADDTSEVRIEKIYNLIAECRYGIHDISQTQLDNVSYLPRFNMPLELGIFLGAKRFGEERHKRKKCLALDSEPHRYDKFISYISGQDIKPHNNEPSELTKVVRDWLRNASDRKGIPDGDFIFERYQAYKRDLPKMAGMFNLNANKLIFNDYTWMVVEWLRTKENRLSQHIEGGD